MITDVEDKICNPHAMIWTIEGIDHQEKLVDDILWQFIIATVAMLATCH